MVTCHEWRHTKGPCGRVRGERRRTCLHPEQGDIRRADGNASRSTTDPTVKGQMSYHSGRMPVTSRMGDELPTPVHALKEEVDEHIKEELCLEIKEENLDHPDAVSDGIVKYECPYFESFDRVNEEIEGKYDVLSAVPFVSADFRDVYSHKEEGKEVTHEKVKAKRKRLVCEVCGKAFPCKAKLVEHTRIHTKEKPFRCEVCSRAFSHKHNVVGHMRVHTKEKSFTCDMCRKSFSVKSNLAAHIRTHTRERPFTCVICNKAFLQKSALARHVKIHANVKPYTCETCNKTYSQKSHLVTHIRTHTRERPFRCDICMKAFIQKCHLLRHMRTHT
ncbi:gastrula zinc finger protein XlCGF7.1-like isoform X1 [Penaeus japonicus]|uniref:gastrula zinc finger protein XlCGF7.1-like isoform X1 n=2 Tax=Penaeus japonicus TaxID=27405 RepID=UPI001C70B321|nr:gastrula zinc finger protein XlCGF7.1-like isoform X1 [Penaeus japonicus]